ncbi:hypothetical protein WJX81_006544 [Elliptochloris bilobata]|uniref:Uncharacterized protein n=1 Tax=Elliptochloris bilobata TaxID=381761 RepID=A0AAW1R2U3_9CHLO
MASWYERSSTWRKIVAVTKRSPAAMAAFTVACFGVPYVVGKGVMWAANPREDSELERMLRERATLDHKMLAKANRERLAVLLEESRGGTGGNERYAASLRGESLGTHSRGTTVGAKVIGHGNAAAPPPADSPR